MSFWNEKYSSTSESERSWSQDSRALSLSLIEQFAASKDEPIVDVGSGATRLIDDLVLNGFRDISALDISTVALSQLKERVGDQATYIESSILEWRPSRSYGLAHDRAVFHFLVDPSDQVTYKRVLASALTLGGYLVLGTFGSDGPEQCSGLPVTRWSSAELIKHFSPEFEACHAENEVHVTPWGSEQNFTWIVLKRVL